ncbi:histidinol-phosphate transaminase [Candidatus Micrarchaeota archaeon]|nr:histidinol-phosphate transaminase [Candidatus Micrarchaeota archaeon]
MSVKKLFRKELGSLKAYKTPDVVASECKLNQNESTLDVPLELKERIARESVSLAFNRYPDASYSGLREVVARKFKLRKENVIAGNGVDEVLYYLMLAFISKGDKVVFPAPSFAMYKICAEVMGAKPVKVLLDKQSFDLTEEFVEESKNAKVVFICSPNNPTGNLVSRKKIEEIVESSKGLVVIDEAYSDFAGEDCLDLLSNERVVVLRTMSKAFSAAGLRLGFGLACEEAISAMDKVRLPWNLSGLSTRIGELLFERERVFSERVKKTIAERERLFSELKKIGGRVCCSKCSACSPAAKVVVFPSQANFLLFKTSFSPKTVYSGLLERGVQVRDVSGYELLEDCLRVSVGTRVENDKFLNALGEVLNKKF